MVLKCCLSVPLVCLLSLQVISQMKNFATLVLFLLLCRAISAQKETSNWVFGNNAGVSWNSGLPVAFSGSQMTQLEGVSSISDPNGQLLFYTNGVKVWNRNNQVMPNGTGLLGSNSTTQTLIVQQPNSPNIYYIFTSQGQIVGLMPRLHYSIVDISLNSGLGDVTLKNVQLYSPTCEKIAAIRHANGKDVWVVTHELHSSYFHSYLITATGISTPVLTNIGSVLTGEIGYMKISPNGKKLALAQCWGFAGSYRGGVEYYDFNTTTGMPSNHIIDSAFYEYAGAYGLEFSPNSRYVYIAGGNVDTAYLLQYDLQLFDSTAIVNSKVVLATDVSEVFDGLQLAPDNKIYATHYHQSFLDVIHNPDFAGLACNFQLHALNLSPGTYGMLGLPNSIQSFYYHPNYFNFQNTCLNNLTAFTIENQNIDSVLWNFGDTASGVSNASTAIQPFHAFSSIDTFSVTLFAFHDSLCDTTIKQVIISPSLTITLLNLDTIVCSGQNVNLCAPSNFLVYQWNTGETTKCITTNIAGNYYVTVTDNNSCRAESNHLAISFYPMPSVSVSVNGDTLSVYNAVTQQWYLDGNAISNATSNVYVATESGNYTVAVTDSNGCTGTSNAILISGIANLVEEVGVSIYPNPVYDKLFVETSGTEIEQINIYNTTGTLVSQTKQPQTKSIDISALAQGVYVAEIRMKDARVKRRFVKMQ